MDGPNTNNDMIKGAPESVDVTSTPMNVPTSTSDVPGQLPTPPAPPVPPTPPPGSPADIKQKIAPQVKPAQTPQVPQSVQKAWQGTHIVKGIQEVLGLSVPNYKTVVNPDGSSSQVKLPNRGRDVGMAIALAALTGAFSGLGERGPGATGRAAQAGFAAGANMRQQAQDKIDQQSQADFLRKQQTLEFNMRIAASARQAGMQDLEENQAIVKQFEPFVDEWESNPNVADIIKFGSKDAPISEDEAEDIKKHSAFDLQRIPVSTVPRLDKDGNQVWIDSQGNIVKEGTQGAHRAWDHGYVLVDRNAKVNLSGPNGPADWLKESVTKWGGIIPGLSPSLIAGQGATGQVSAQQAGKWQLLVNQLDVTQKQLDDFVKVVDEGKKEGDLSFIPPIDLKSAIKKGVVTLSDIQKLQNAAGNSSQGNSTVLNTRIDAVSKKDPQAWARLQSLFGGDALESYKQRVIAQGKAAGAEEEEKLKPMDRNRAISVISKEKANPGSVDASQVRQANAVLKTERDQMAQEEADKLAIQNKAEQDAYNEAHGYLSIPNNWSLEDANKVRQMDQFQARKYLESKGVNIPSNFADLYQISQNKRDIKGLPVRLSKGTGQMDETTGSSYISQFLNPVWNQQDYSAAREWETQVGSSKIGTIGGTLLAAGTASQHISSMTPVWGALHNGNWRVANTVLNEAARQSGKSPQQVAQLWSSAVSAEVEKVVSGSAPYESRMKELQSQLGTANSPQQMLGIADTMIDLMHGRIVEGNDREMQYFGRPIKGISPHTSAMFLRAGYSTPWLDQPQGAQGTGLVNGKLHWLGQNNSDLGPVDFNYWKK